MYLADYHMHSRWSPDARYPMAAMAEAAVSVGLNEICFTDHVEIMDSGETRRNTFDWATLERDTRKARASSGDRIVIRRGVEFGEAPRDFTWSEHLLKTMPEMDFIIGSIHQLSEKYGYQDLYFAASHDPLEADRQITDYLEWVWKLAKWGKFSVLGHLTLPLRYMNENRGLHMTFDGREEQVGEIFRVLIENGCGIEINTNRGNTPLPDAKWVRLYHSLGGRIITLGSDAHTPEYVGCHIREGQRMLRECGFHQYCTFKNMEPIFHDLV